MLNIWWNFLFSTLLLKEVLSRKKQLFLLSQNWKVPSKMMGTFLCPKCPIAKRKENIPRGWNYVTLRYSSKIEVCQFIKLSSAWKRLAAVAFFHWKIVSIFDFVWYDTYVGEQRKIVNCLLTLLIIHVLIFLILKNSNLKKT